MHGVCFECELPDCDDGDLRCPLHKRLHGKVRRSVWHGQVRTVLLMSDYEGVVFRGVPVASVHSLARALRREVRLMGPYEVTVRQVAVSGGLADVDVWYTDTPMIR